MSDPVEPFYKDTSPTPWKVHQSEDAYEQICILDANGDYVPAEDRHRSDLEYPNNPHLIVAAVNAFIETLRKMEETVIKGTGVLHGPIIDPKETQK